MITAHECESCHTVVYVEGKEEPYCPRCRGRMLQKEEELPRSAKKIHCPQCDRDFYMMKEPFKCPFCDYSFTLGSYW
jgi:Zn finger protein HypA/HybF involved in hydrogenase expression